MADDFTTVRIPQLDEAAEILATDLLVLQRGDGPAQTAPAQALMEFMEANGVGGTAAATAVAARDVTLAARDDTVEAKEAAEAAAEVLVGFPSLAVNEAGELLWRDGNGVDRAISVDKPKIRYFAVLGESTTRGAGNNLGDATPTTVEAYEMEADGSLTYPLAEPVGGAVGGSSWPEFANEIRRQLHERVVIDNMAVGSTTLLAAAGTLANSWQVGGGLLAPAIARINANVTALLANPDQNTTGLEVELIWGGNPNDVVMLNGTTVTGALYQAALTAVFNELKAGITAAPLGRIHVIQGGDDNDGTAPGAQPINDRYREVRAATEAAVDAEAIARIASRIARSFAYDAKRYMYDQVHWNRTGCNLLGKVVAREVAKAVPTVPFGALTPLAVTLYEDTSTATANTASASHTPQPGCKAMVVMAGAMANTVATGTTFSGATFDGGAMALMNEEISQVAAAGTSAAARAAAWLLNNADGFDATPQDIVVNTAGVRNNISFAVIEYGEVVLQEAGWAFKSNAAVTEVERKAYSALDCSASVLALSVATSASVLTHTMTGVVLDDEGGQTDGTNSSQVAIATGPIDMNVETLLKAQFSAAVRCAVLYSVLVRRPEDGELEL